MTTWLTSTRKRSSKRNSTSVIGFGPKNGVQATSSSSRGDSSSPSSSRKTLPMSGGGTASSSSNRSMLISGVSDILSLQMTHSQCKNSQRNPWATDMQTSEINTRLLRSTCKMQRAQTTQKEASLWPPRCPAEIYAQKQCLHFFTILLTAMSERWLYLRCKSSQTRDWWTQSFQST